MRLAEGTTIEDRFQIISYIGEGGMGTVYNALQVGFNRTVALKFLDWKSTGDNAEAFARLEREAQALSELQHKNIVSVYGFYKSDSFGPFLVMEYLAGQSLQLLLSNRTPLAPERSIEIVIEICEALACAHAGRIVHRDIKPSNIILGEPYGLKIIDFGLIKLLPDYGKTVQQLTEAGCAVGSVLYMSPEQCTASVCDERSDIYAVGCVLHHCLTGVPPFEGDNSVAIMLQHVHDAVPALSSACPDRTYPEKLQDVILRAMAKAPEHRYQSASELLADLKLIASGKSELVSTSASPARLDAGQTRTSYGSKFRHGIGSSPSKVAQLLMVSLVCLLLGGAIFVGGVATGSISAQQFDGVRIAVLEAQLRLSHSSEENARLSSVLASQYDRDQIADEAIYYYGKFVEQSRIAFGISSRYLDAELALADCLRRYNHTQDAVDRYKQVLGELILLLNKGQIDDTDRRICTAAKNLQQLSLRSAGENALLSLSADLVNHRILAEELLQLVVDSGSPKGRVLARTQLASLQCRDANAKNAVNLFNDLIDVTKEPRNKIELCYFAGQALKQNHHYTEAIQFILAGLHEAEKHGFDNSDASVYEQAASCFIQIRQYNEAKSCFQRAVAIAKAQPRRDTLLIIRSLDGLGQAEYHSANYSAAEKSLREEESFLRRSAQPDFAQLVHTIGMIGDSLTMQKKYYRAEKEFQRALELIDSSSPREQLISLRGAIAEKYRINDSTPDSERPKAR